MRYARTPPRCSRTRSPLRIHLHTERRANAAPKPRVLARRVVPKARVPALAEAFTARRRRCAPLRTSSAPRQPPQAVASSGRPWLSRVHQACTDSSQLAPATILSRYPTAVAFQGVSVRKLARIIYNGTHKVGKELARTLIEAAEKSVGSHHSEPYRLRIKYLCQDLDVLRRRLKDLARDIERKLDDHEVGNC
jgi:hypothetical protein